MAFILSTGLLVVALMACAPRAAQASTPGLIGLGPHSDDGLAKIDFQLPIFKRQDAGGAWQVVPNDQFSILVGFQNERGGGLLHPQTVNADAMVATPAEFAPWVTATVLYQRVVVARTTDYVSPAEGKVYTINPRPILTGAKLFMATAPIRAETTVGFAYHLLGKAGLRVMPDEGLVSNATVSNVFAALGAVVREDRIDLTLGAPRDAAGETVQLRFVAQNSVAFAAKNTDQTSVSDTLDFTVERD